MTKRKLNPHEQWLAERRAAVQTFPSISAFNLRRYVRIRLAASTGGAHFLSGDLKPHWHWYTILNRAYLLVSQLPDKIPGTPLTRPDGWK